MAEENKAPKTWNELQDEVAYAQAGLSPQSDVPPIQMNNSVDQGAAAADKIGTALLRSNPYYTQPYGLEQAARAADNEFYSSSGWDRTEEAASQGFLTDRRDQAIGLESLDNGHDLEHNRAVAQSNANKLINGTAKFFPTMGTTMADGIVGSVAGAFTLGKVLGEGIVTGDMPSFREAFNATVNNPVSQRILAVQDNFEEIFPNWYTDYERNDGGHWWEHINANMIGDHFIKNLGFTAGAMASGYLTSAGIQLARQKTIANNIFRGAVAASQGDETVAASLRRLATNAVDTDTLWAESKKAAKRLSHRGLFDQISGGVGGAIGEARIEALHAAKEFRESQMQELNRRFAETYENIDAELFRENSDWFDVVDVVNPDGTVTQDYRIVDPYAQALKQRRLAEASQEYDTMAEHLDSEAEKVANTVFALNVPLLTFDNVFEFGKLFGGGFTTMRKQMRRVGRSGDTYYGRGSVGGAVVAGLSKPLVEGFEEVNQKVFSEGAKTVGDTDMARFHNDGKDAKAISNIMDWLRSMRQSAVDVYADPTTWEEFAIGALTGSISIYTGGAAGTDTVDKWQNGIGATIAQGIKERNDNRKLAEQLNKYISDGKLKDLAEAYTRHVKYADLLADAAEHGDAFVWQNTQSKDIINMVTMFDDAGRLSDLEEWVDRYTTLSNDDIEDVRAALAQEDGSGITTNSSPADVRKFVTDRANDLKKIIKDYNDMYDSLVRRADINTDREVLKEMVFTGTQMKNFERRFIDMWEGSDEKAGIKQRLDALIRAEADNAVDKDGNPLSETAKKTMIESEWNALNRLLSGSGNPSVFDSMPADSMLSQMAVKSLTKIQDALKKDKKNVDETLISDMQDFLKILLARNSYYRKLYDPANNIMRNFHRDAKTPEQTKEEVRAEDDRKASASLDEPQSLNDVRAAWLGKDVKQDDVDKNKKAMLGKKGNAFVDLYNKMQAVSDKLKQSLDKLSTDQQAKEDASAMFSYVLENDDVDDLHKLYDFEFPASPDLEKFDAMLRKYNPRYMVLSNTTLFGPQAQNYDPVALRQRYDAARTLYNRAINRMKSGNQVQGRTNEYGEPVTPNPVKPATPAPNPEPNLPDPKAKPVTPAENPTSPDPVVEPAPAPEPPKVDTKQKAREDLTNLRDNGLFMQYMPSSFSDVTGVERKYDGVDWYTGDRVQNFASVVQMASDAGIPGFEKYKDAVVQVDTNVRRIKKKLADELIAELKERGINDPKAFLQAIYDYLTTGVSPLELKKKEEPAVTPTESPAPAVTPAENIPAGEDVSGPLPGGRLPGSDKEEYHQDFHGLHPSVFDVRFGEDDMMPRLYFKSKSGVVYMVQLGRLPNRWDIYRRQKGPRGDWVFYAVDFDEFTQEQTNKIIDNIVPKAWRDILESGEAEKMNNHDMSAPVSDGLMAFLYRQNGIIMKNTHVNPEERARVTQAIIAAAGQTEVPIEKSEEKMNKVFPNPEIPFSEEAKARLGKPINVKYSENTKDKVQQMVYEADYKIDGTDEVMHMRITQSHYTSTQGEPKVSNYWEFFKGSVKYATPEDMLKSIDEAKRKAEGPKWVPVTEEQKVSTADDKQADVDAQTTTYAKDARTAEAAADHAELQVEDGAPRNTNGMVLYEESAIPQKDTEEMAKLREAIESKDTEGIIQADLRDFDIVAFEKLERKKKGERVAGGNYMTVYSFVKNNNGFGFVNMGNLHVDNPISFVIYPESTVTSVKSENGNPVKTIYMTMGYHLVGVLRDRNSTYQRREIYGHKQLFDAIMREYNAWSKKHNPDTEVFTFSKKSKVWRLRKGRMWYTNEDKPINSYPSYSTDAPIVFYSSELGIVPILNNNKWNDIDKRLLPMELSSMRPGAFYYLVTNADGSFMPVRLTLAHFNDKEAPGQEGSDIWKGVEKALKPLFEDQTLWDTSTPEKKAASRKACLEQKHEATDFIWLGDVAFSFGRTGATQETTTFRVYRKKTDARGEVIKDKDGNEQYEQLFDMDLYDKEGNVRTADALVRNAIIGIQVKVNPQIQVSMKDRPIAVKTMKKYIDNGYVMANVDDLQVVGGSFYINPYDPVTKDFVSVVPKGREQKPVNGVDSNNSKEAAEKRRKEYEQQAAETRREHSIELRQILNRRKSRLRTVPDKDFMDSDNVSVEARDKMLETAKQLQTATSVLEKINIIQQVMNQAYDLGVIPNGLMQMVNVMQDEIRASGYKVVNLYGQDYNPRKDVTYTAVNVHYPSDVAIISRVETPLVTDASGKVIQMGKVQVSKGDGTKMALRHRDDIDFNEDAHIYTRKADGKRLEGVTTLMSNQGVGADYSQVGDNDPIKKKKILARAAAKGKAVHSAIQDYDDGIDKSPEGAYTGNKTRTEDMIDTDTGEVMGQVTVAVKAAVDNYAALGLPVLASEYLVSDGTDFASMIDKVLRVDDNTVDLVDLKTTSILHEDALKHQLSIYAYLFERQNPGMKVRNLYGLHIQKNNQVSLVKVDRMSDTSIETLMNNERIRMMREQQQPQATTQPAESTAPAPDVLPAEEPITETPVGTQSETPVPEPQPEADMTAGAPQYTEEDYREFEDFDPNFMSVRQTRRHRTKANLQRELAWLDMVLPNIKAQNRLQIQRGLINMGRANAYAYGEVTRGLMTISDEAASGTVYHEAFHWVMNYVLSDEERKTVLREAREAYGAVSVETLEEHLADDFREWKISGNTRYNRLGGAFDGRGFFRSIAEFFRRLYLLVTHHNELMPHVLSVYRSIDNGEYAEEEGTFNPNTDSRGIIADRMDEFKKKVTEFNNPHFVKIVKTEDRPDGSVRLMYALPEGHKLSEQDHAFPEDKMEEAREAIRDAYRHGLGVDLSNGVDSIHYSEKEGFVFTSVVPGNNVSLATALKQFDEAIGKAGLNFKYLSAETKEMLEAQGYNEEKFDKAPQAEKNHLLRCIGV